MIGLEEEIADCERRSEYAAGKKGFRCIKVRRNFTLLRQKL